MRPNPIDKQSSPNYKWGDNCESFILADCIGLSVKQEIMPAGTRERLHYHKKAVKVFYILKWAATFLVENYIIEVFASQALKIEPGSKHYIENKTAEVLEFLVISQPAIKNDRIEI